MIAQQWLKKQRHFSLERTRRELGFSHGAVTCITALELEKSMIYIERAARRHCRA
jgi:hypothetical protein